MSLEKKIALITGSGRGIGEQTAYLLAENGARVILLSRSGSEINQVAKNIVAKGGEALAFVCDVSAQDQVKKVFAEVLAQWGPIEILINNAAVAPVKPFLQLTADDWHSALEVNIMGTVFASQCAFEHMQQAGGGAIVNVSSLGGLKRFQKFEGFSAYSVSKHGVVGLTECLSVEGRPFKIAVNCVAPGAVDTQMLRDVAPGFKTATKPIDVALIILFLVQAGLSGKITGSVIPFNSNG